MLQLANLIAKKTANKKGAVLVIAGFSIFALTSMAVVSVNVANLHQVSVELRNAADASALAGVTLLPIVPAEATPIITQVAGQHNAGGQPVTLLPSDIIFGNYNLGNGIFTPNIQPFNAVQVTARRDGSAPSGPVGIFGGGIVGVPAAGISKTALAVQDNRITGACIAPYAIYKPMVDQDGDGNFDIGLIRNIYAGQGQNPNTPDGNFAWLDFDGDSNPTGDLIQWLSNPFCNLDLPDTVPGTPGTRGAVTEDEWNALVGRTIIMPVYEDFSIDAGGNNGTYQLIELVAVKLLQQVNLTGGPPDYVTPCMSQTSNKRRICVEVVSAGSSSFEIDTDPDVVPNNSLFKIRLAQ